MKNPSTLKSIFLNFVEFSLTAAAPGFVLSRQGAAGSHREAAQRKAAVRAACWATHWHFHFCCCAPRCWQVRARAGMGSGLTNRSTLQHIAGYRANICSATAWPLAAVLEPGLFFEQMQAAHSSESWKEAPSKASAVWGKVRYAPKFRFLVLELFSSHFTVLFSPFLAPLGFLSLSLLVTCLLDGSQASLSSPDCFLLQGFSVSSCHTSNKIPHWKAFQHLFTSFYSSLGIVLKNKREKN